MGFPAFIAASGCHQVLLACFHKWVMCIQFVTMPLAQTQSIYPKKLNTFANCLGDQEKPCNSLMYDDLKYFNIS